MNSGGFFEVDADFDDITESRDWMTYPELRLLWAVIERTVRDILGNNAPERVAAEEWLYSAPAEVPDYFSFQWICDTLALNPVEIYQKIEKAKAQRQSDATIVLAQAA